MNARIDTLHATAPTTPLPLSAEQQIGQIAVQLPGATAVFRRLKLDFCCGGQVSLAKAAADKGLDADAVLAALIRMARRVEAVHRDHPQVPVGLADHLEAMHEELLSHMLKEEQVLFPMLKNGGNPFVGQPIGMMRAEHVDHGEALDKLNALTNDATPPQGACNTWRALYAGIAQLGDDLINHIHLENNVLFPRFEASAAPAQACATSACGCQ